MKLLAILFLFTSFTVVISRNHKYSDDEKINKSNENHQTYVKKTRNMAVNSEKNGSIKNIKQQRLEDFQASENCKIETLIKIRNNINNVTEQQVLYFLKGFNKMCDLNVEYSEFSNYLLFQLLQKQPKLVLKVLTNNKAISYKYINKNLTNPINDSINLEEIYKKIKNIYGYDTIKNKLLISIKIAIKKYD